MRLAARWLVVLTTAIMVLAGNVLAMQPAPAVSKCDASCAAKCPCCIQPAEKSSEPLAPVSTTRTVLANDLQVVAALVLFVIPPSDEAALVTAKFSVSNLPVGLPLFLRDRALLI
jgi:hypothetical protein